MGFWGIQLRSVLQQVLNISIPWIGLQIMFPKLQPYLPGANEMSVYLNYGVSDYI